MDGSVCERRMSNSFQVWAWLIQATTSGGAAVETSRTPSPGATASVCWVVWMWKVFRTMLKNMVIRKVWISTSGTLEMWKRRLWTSQSKVLPSTLSMAHPVEAVTPSPAFFAGEPSRAWVT